MISFIIEMSGAEQLKKDRTNALDVRILMLHFERDILSGEDMKQQRGNDRPRNSLWEEFQNLFSELDLYSGQKEFQDKLENVISSIINFKRYGEFYSYSNLCTQEVTTIIETFKTGIQRLSPQTRSQDNIVATIMQSLYVGQARV
jgi:hypothetical protein